MTDQIVKPKYVRYQYTMSVEEAKELDEWGASRGIPRSEVIQTLCRAGMKEKTPANNAQELKRFCIEQAAKIDCPSRSVLDVAKELYDWLKDDDVVISGSPIPLWHSDVDA